MLLVILAGASPPAFAGSEGWRWPLDLPPVLTSSFGEFRSQHLHAGIDLGTGGRTGVRCFAAGDGSVVRMRMSPFGYGKALYVQLDGGPLVVYAHLSAFGEPMAARARREQERLRRYSFDVHLPPGEIRVRKGDVVAWSGDTGVGVPHLHFEVRDGDVARNPQTAGFGVRDDVPPVLEEVSIEPWDAASHVEGATVRRRLGAAPLRAGGRLAFSIRAWDAAARGSHRQAPYRAELRVDGQTLYRAVYERFDYAHNHHLVLEYDQERLVSADQRAFCLYKRPGNRLDGHEATAGTEGLLWAPGISGRNGFEVGPGAHVVEVEVADVAGQVTSRRFDLDVGAPPHIAMLRGQREAGSLRFELRARDPDAQRVGAPAESLAVRVEWSADRGATWVGTPVEPGAPDHRGWHRWTGNVSDAGGGILALRARVADASGLETVRTWTTGAEREVEAELALEVQASWRPRWLEVTLDSGVLLETPPTLYLLQADGARRPVAVQQVDTMRYRALRDLSSLPERLEALEIQARAADGRRAVVRRPLRAHVVRERAAARVVDLHPALEIEIDSGALFEDVALRARTLEPSDLPLGRELVLAGPAVWVEPRAAALDRAVRVKLRVQGAEPGVGLFEVTRGGSLRFLSAERDADGAFVAKTRFLGPFAVLADTTPPTIRPLRVRPRGKRPQLVFGVADFGADLAGDGIEVELDGAFEVAEWDPETGTVVVQPNRDLARGTHRLTARGIDQVGNRAEKTFTFQIP